MIEEPAKKAAKKAAIEARLREHRFEALELLDKTDLKEGKDYIVGGVYLQGSQNYGADIPTSDVDSKLIIYPTHRALVLKKKTTFDFTISKNEKVSVKSFVDFTDLFFRTNINTLEMLTTPYRIPCQFMEKIREDGWVNRLAYKWEKQLWTASVGMMLQKQKSLLKGTVTTKPLVDKFGYDPKDGAHIVRIFSLLNELGKGQPFTSAIWLKNQAFYQSFSLVRNGELPKEEVIAFTNGLIEEIKATEKLIHLKESTGFTYAEEREKILEDYLSQLA